MQLLKTDLLNQFLIPVVSVIIFLIIMWLLKRNEKLILEKPFVKNDYDNDNMVKNSIPKPWNEDQTIVATYVALFLNYKNLNNDYLNLLVKVTGRTKGALIRKFSRINSISNNPKEGSILDRKIHSMLAHTTLTFAMNQFKNSFIKMGGDWNELEGYLN